VNRRYRLIASFAGAGGEMGYFTPKLFSFLRQLKRNNNRDWFNKNKERYIEHLQQRR